MVLLLSIYAACCLAPNTAQEGAPPDGFYAVIEKGAGPRVKRNDGAEIILGERVSKHFGEASIRSVANDNSRFVLDLKNAGPLPKGPDQGPLALVIGGVNLALSSRTDPHPDGTIDLSFSVGGEVAARKIAARLQVEPQLRKHPGHRFEVRWTPDKETYQVGEVVTLQLEIRNTGHVPFTFTNGGRQRGPRNNQFRFLAYRSAGYGTAIPDTGDPANFGGFGSFRTIKPGESFTASISLDKWFVFSEPDTYRITGIFELSLLGSELRRPIWDDLAVGQCDVRIERK